jgi:hypothetical protein
MYRNTWGSRLALAKWSFKAMATLVSEEPWGGHCTACWLFPGMWD